MWYLGLSRDDIQLIKAVRMRRKPPVVGAGGLNEVKYVFETNKRRRAGDMRNSGAAVGVPAGHRLRLWTSYPFQPSQREGSLC
jgi:hypothetical protein